MTTETIGQQLRRLALALAPALAATYTAGLLTGQAVHRLNDTIAWLVTGKPELHPLCRRAWEQQERTSRQLAHVSRTRFDLAHLTVVQLRGVVRARLGAQHRPGGRRISQARKADLLAALAA